MKDKLRYAIIGAGGIAQAYAQAFEQSETSKLVAVCDTRAEAAQALGERVGGASFTTIAEMLAGAEFDAAVVCTPPATHEAICAELTSAGKHVLCEKPLSVDVESARRMIEQAREANVMFTMASKFRYAEDVVRAKAIVEGGALGEIVLFENAFTSHVQMGNRWNSQAEISGGGVLIDNGTHSFDIMRYFLGALAEVQVVEGKRSQNLAVDETVRIFARSQQGVMGSVDLSWSINKELENYISIYGSQGTLHVGWRESKYKLQSAREWTVFGKGYDKVQSFRSQLDNFSRAVKGEERLRITPDDALASVESVEAAYDALRQNQWTAITKRQAADIKNFEAGRLVN